MRAFAYRRSGDQDGAAIAHHPVVIVGAGPAGLVLALDLAAKGHHAVVLDRRTALSDGSRAICWSKRTLEIMGRLGLADGLAARGVTWQQGRVFHRDREIFDFDLLPEAGHQRPAFVNLQQFMFEDACVAACEATGSVDIRWGHDLTRVETRDDGVRLEIATPDGRYGLTADWLIACDGARSTVRQQLGLSFVGRTFDAQFLICDIKMKDTRPTERWFWFDPPFNPGQSALLHRQADDVWRLDFQIDPAADRETETRPENVARRVRAMLGDIDFSFEWISCYRFHCRRIERFREGRVLLVGDAAHQVSPFGARGGNSAVQDADNLAWKLDLVLRERAPDCLLDSYDSERRQAADENILASSRTTDFISPDGPGAASFRDAVLELAETEPFARRLLNSGRLSTPTTYVGSPLSSPDAFAEHEAPRVRPGAAALDAPVDNEWLLAELGSRFTVLEVRGQDAAPMLNDAAVVSLDGVRADVVVVGSSSVIERYVADAGRSAIYLVRPDQHIAARWYDWNEGRVAEALAKATGRG